MRNIKLYGARSLYSLYIRGKMITKRLTDGLKRIGNKIGKVDLILCKIHVQLKEHNIFVVNQAGYFLGLR